MRIKELRIKNFKSLVNFKLEELKPFCAFVGPNASGKSNIFEALEFVNYIFRYSSEAPYFFGGKKQILSYNPIAIEEHEIDQNNVAFYFEFKDKIIIDFFLRFVNIHQNDPDDFRVATGHMIHKLNNAIEVLNPFEIRNLNERDNFLNSLRNAGLHYENDYEQFVDRFTRLFIKNYSLVRTFGSPRIFSNTLSPDASNLEQILEKILNDKNSKDEFIEWLKILIPEFENIEVKKSNFSSEYNLFIYEKSSSKPFPRELVSDGTYNILALMAVVFQTNQPQFLCIEEPENGLHPQAIQSLVDLFREKSENGGHHIWINTHSPTLVRCLQIEEIILVNKFNGTTITKQLTKDDNIDIKTDEAWLTNALGGGTLWSM
ncbi:AAA family ATPase [soil metagenome]